MAMNERQLVKAAQRGDVQAFGELVRANQRTLVATARQIIRDYHAAEDMAQEALIEAFRHLGTLRDAGKFRGWLFTILRNKCYRYLQRRHPEELPLDEAAEELSCTLALDEEAPFAELLDMLPVQGREILAARYLYALSFKEIGEALGISEAAARVRCTRARAQLRVLLQQHEAEERTLRRAMAGLAIPVSSAFTSRVLEEVQMFAGRYTAVPRTRSAARRRRAHARTVGELEKPGAARRDSVAARCRKNHRFSCPSARACCRRVAGGCPGGCGCAGGGRRVEPPQRYAQVYRWPAGSGGAGDRLSRRANNHPDQRTRRHLRQRVATR